MTARSPSLLDALLPIGVLVVLLGLSVYLFGDGSSSGPNQIALMSAAFVAGLVGLKNGLRWADIEEGILAGIHMAMKANLILLAVGALIGTWILAGTVPTMIWLGLKLISAEYFYVTSCLICALTALSIGSSWTVAGTLGIGLMGVAAGLGLDPAITAGAIISGAYFGDKLSPLSDTTNLAPAAAGADLFAHIRNMLRTTTPALLIALAIFFVLGQQAGASHDTGRIAEVLAALEAQFRLGWHLLLPVAFLLFLAMRQWAAFPAVFLAALLGAVFALVFQPEVMSRLADPAAGVLAPLKTVWSALFAGYESASGNAELDGLLSKGGMGSMLTTVWLIICAMCFGGVLERLGLLQRLLQSALRLVRSDSGLVASTITTSIGTNVITADQYIALVLPGRMYRAEYEKRSLAPTSLSRALEDGGTLTSVLVPWNTCGAYMAATLGVATLSYLPYCFFNLIMPVLAIVLAYVLPPKRQAQEV
ncbi:Na+/H+ antiporter NhaC [Ectopseudomonas hydrolytica]|uniref:Na+/H+ antiporter NhaC n=1 Tax=Ectopseudomonas hydrolytica TaxID=2493633 RepID=A0ABY5A781_9GAMM|nr:Na+/H+ antiporter NhaC [Pseudomonas hydrolytica]ARS50301.1 sodium:proton antiporter [Pseudomonas mendocina]MBF8163269.1 Na+/H+ antiporter NhaC [Pseudomonas mendocina]USR38818.1 Na+/H+ antiporter NhaC [Pseudomonas hydrolytica]UTH30723.1 Na+/H+ antiporter NhaC [Pseudomonas hydrolytica]UZZ09929.1 Na+/H+ antiporter NhaC [Pseudomonas mendocina]